MSDSNVDNSDNNSTTSSSSIGSGPYVSDNEVIRCYETESDPLEEEPDEVTKVSHWFISDVEKKYIPESLQAGKIYPTSFHGLDQYPVIRQWIEEVIQDGWGFAAYSIMQLFRKGRDAERIKHVLFDVCCVSSTKALKVLTFTKDTEDNTRFVKYNTQLTRMILNHTQEMIGHSLNIIHGILDVGACRTGEDITQMVAIWEETAQDMFLPQSLHMDFKRYRDMSYSLVKLFSQENQPVTEGNIFEMMADKAVQTESMEVVEKGPLNRSQGSFERFAYTLDWKHPQLDGGSEFTVHTFEMKEFELEWQKIGRCLKEGSLKHVSVRELNEVGLGEPSTPTEPHHRHHVRKYCDNENLHHHLHNATHMFVSLRGPQDESVTLKSLTDDDKADKEAMRRWEKAPAEKECDPQTDHLWNQDEAFKIREELKRKCRQSDLKILFFGPTGHGKSSLGNSFLSGLDESNQVSHMFTVGKSDESVTTQFHSVKILGGNFLIDMPGIFESNAITDMNIENIASGKVPFYAQLSSDLKAKGIFLEPSPRNNDVSCVVIVLRYGEKVDGVKHLNRQLDVIKKLAGKGVISYQLVITHLDKCDWEFKDSDRLPYMDKSDKVQREVNRIAEETNIVPYCISFVKNYVEDDKKHPNATLLHLRVLKKIIHAACDQRRKRKDMACLQHDTRMPNNRLILLFLGLAVTLLAICYALWYKNESM